MRIFVLLFSVVTSLNVFSQTIFIKDKVTEETIPFVKVYPEGGNPFLTDIDGRFAYKTEWPFISLRAVGYRDTLVQTNQIVAETIFMESAIKEIKEIKVIAGENPAHRIIDLAISNRKKNDPLANDGFQYHSYSKFIFGAKENDLAAIKEDTKDTTEMEIRKFFNEQHIFLIETASTRTFIPPSRDKETITAYKVSGFSDPMFSTFANELQSFSFYDNQFNLLGKTYINPIAFGGTKRYLFILEDTTVVNNDTTFMIFYRPRKGKNFEGMTGHLYINSNGWAIEKVTASPYEDTTGFKIKIVQEYAFLENRKWFPQKLSTVLDFGQLATIEGLAIEGKGNTYIQNVHFDPKDVKLRNFDNVSVSTAEGAGETPDQQWDSLRVFKITDKEKRTYEMIDSLSQAEKLEKRLYGLKTIAEGKLPLGPLALDLARIINYNQYEGCRLGLGLETSKKLMKSFSIGGYFGWATRDKAWKYGGYSTIHLSRKHGVNIHLKYQQDLMERGGTSFQKGNFSLNNTSLYRQFFITNMERQQLAEISLSANVRSNLKLMASSNFQRITFTEGYQFQTANTSDSLLAKTGYDLAETSLELSWNIREKVMMLGDQRVSKGTKYPKIILKASKGWKGWFTAELDYIRLFGEIQQNIPIRGVGELIWTLNGGQTIGNVPLSLLQVGNGTGLEWNLSVENTFETMLPSEFYNSRQAALFTRFNFNKIKTKAKWNEPQFSLHHAIGFGDMTPTGLHSVDFRSMDKGFYEGGLLLNGLLTSNLSGIGVGVFYRYGFYAQPNWRQNILPKVSIRFNL